MKKTKALNFILPLCTLALILALWAIVATATDNPYLYPSVDAVCGALIDTLKTPSFYSAYFATLCRSLIAFLISFAIALVLAVLGKRFKYFERAISPLVKIVRALPTIAIALLLVFWINSLVAPVIVTMLVVLPTTFESVKDSLNAVDEKQIEMCNLFGVKQRQIFFKVQLPQIAPTMFTTIGAGLSLNLKLMVAAEVLTATHVSIGTILRNEKYIGDGKAIATMMAVVIFCVITGLIIEFVFNLISKKVGKWQ